MAEEIPLEAGTQQPQEQNVEPIAVQPTDTPVEPKTTSFPDDWRERMSGGDEKALKLFSRYGDPEAFGRAFLEKNRMISSGEYQKPLSADATEEEIAAYREANGIPATAEDYELKLEDGLVLGDQDKPIVDEFLKIAHNYNLPPDQVNGVVNWWVEAQDKQAEAQQNTDIIFKEESTELLRDKWGPDYKQNINYVNALFDSAPEGLKDDFYGARLADGTILGNNPQALEFLSSLARQINPVSTVVPGSGANAAQEISDEKAKIEKLMGDPNSDYWKNESMQKRYQDLVFAESRIN